MSKAAELAKWGEVSTNGQVSGRRNIVINGAMNVAQRSASVTGIGATSGYYTIDRYQIIAGATAGRFTMAQVADVHDGFANAMKLTCTTADASIAAGEYMGIQYRIEGQDLQQIKKGTSDAEKVTISFYVKGNASATYMLEVKDSDNTRLNQNQFAVTTDWTRIEITLNADTTGAFTDDNGLSLELTFWLHGGSTYTSGTYTANTWAGQTNANRLVGISSFFDSTDRTFFLTGLQMEVGSVATPFEHRSYGEELALCQRYFLLPYGDTDNTNYALQGPVDAQVWWLIWHPVKMRVEPTQTVYGGSNKSQAGKALDATNTDYETIQTTSFGHDGAYTLLLHSPGTANGNYSVQRIELDAEL